MAYLKYPRQILIGLLIHLSATFSFAQNAPASTPAGTGLPTGVPSSTAPGSTTTGTPTNPNTANSSKGNLGVKKGAEKTVNTGTSSSSTAVDSTGKASVSPEIEALRQRIFGYSIFADKSAFTVNADNQIATPQNYYVGPGDELNISIYNYVRIPEMTVLVDRDGYIDISIKAIGKVYVAGKTIQEIKKLLIDKFSKDFPSLLGNGAGPRSILSVTVGNIRSVTVFVTGQAIKPGSYSLSSLSTAFNALYQAGGPNESGTFRTVKIIRDNEVASTFDLYDKLIGSSFKGDLKLRDNDVIQVDYYKTRVEILGKVRREGLFEMKPSENLSDLIRFAGGFQADAFKANISIVRFTDTEKKIVDVLAADFEKFPLKDGDVITVKPILDRFENLVSVNGAVFRDGDYSLETSPSLLSLIRTAGGLREEAFASRVTLNRTKEDMTVERININLADMIAGQVPDIKLQRLDQITVPSRFDLVEASTVKISGEINNSEAGVAGLNYPYMANMTLQDLLIQAGGLKESADYNRVTVNRRKRDANAKAADAQIGEVSTISVADLTKSGGDAGGFVLLPYDEIIVPKSANYQKQQYVRIEGEVLLPGLYALVNKNDKITDLIKRAGGLTDLAYPRGATLSRVTIRQSASTIAQADSAQEALSEQLTSGNAGNLNTPVAKNEPIGINLPLILKQGESSDENLIVQEGDIIVIPKRLETVEMNGELLYPTTVKYGKNMRLIDYVSQSGGFTKKSLRSKVYVVYPNGSSDRTRRFLGFNVYPKVEPGSKITVPAKEKGAMTALQLLQSGVGISTSLFSLITSVLLFRSIR